MKILFAVHGYKPAYRIGGPILSVSALAETLVQRGHEVTVFTTNSNLGEDLDVPLNTAVDVEGVSVWYFQRSEPFQKYLPWVPYLAKSSGFLYSPPLRAELARLVPTMDLVHTHMPFVYPTYAAARAALRAHKPLFYHQRGVFDPARLRFRGVKKKLYIDAFELPVLRRATTLIALTEAEVESYRALGITTPCVVIPNGVHADDYRTCPAPGFVERCGISPGARVILFMGRVHPIKGAHVLLEAFIELSKIHPEAVLVMAGPDEFGLEAEFRARVGNTGLESRVLFPGMVSGGEKLDWLARADIFSLPSDAEGFSMAILEALASSTPVVISPGCHFPEVERSGAGVVVPATALALTSALGQLLSDDEERKRMAVRARALALEYAWGSITDRMIEVYEEGIARSQASQ